MFNIFMFLLQFIVANVLRQVFENLLLNLVEISVCYKQNNVKNTT